MIDKILNVNKTLCAERKSKLFGTFNNVFEHSVIKIIRGINGNRVAAVNSGSFNVFHNAGDQNILAVGYNINLKLCSHHILVNEHGIFNFA